MLRKCNLLQRLWSIFHESLFSSHSCKQINVSEQRTVYRFDYHYQVISHTKKSDFYIIFLEKLTIFQNHFWQNSNIIIYSPLIPMLLPTFRTRKKNSDFTIFHFIADRIHRTLTFTCSISRNWTIYMFWSKTKGAMITTGFLCFGNFFSTIETRKRFVNGFHKNNPQIEIKLSFILRTSFPLE